MGRTLFSVDVGGTFTDVVMVRDGQIHVTKVPSDAAATHLPVIEGARRLGVQDAAVFNHASTQGLNAVLTRSLPKVGLDRKSTRLNSSHERRSRMPSSA